MRISLNAKNKLGYIDGMLKAPSKDTKSHPWQHCNDMVLSWILNSIESNIIDSVVYLSTAREIWEDLK